MKSLFGLFAIILFYSCMSLSSNKGCEQLKNGTFKFHLRTEQGDIFYSITRNDSIQIEVNNNTGSITKLSVRWTDKCKYELRLLESNSNFPDSIQQMRKVVPLKTEILSSTDNYYIFRAKRDNADYVMIDTMWIDK